MPSGPLVASRLIVNTVLAVDPKRIIDLGMGTGKYGFLIREQSDLANGRIDREAWQIQIDGVEGYAAYIGGHQQAVYDSITVAEVVDFLSRSDAGSYDFALALDIIEHFSPADAVAFVKDALRVSEYVLISTPKGFYAQQHGPLLPSWRPCRACTTRSTATTPGCSPAPSASSGAASSGSRRSST